MNKIENIIKKKNIYYPLFLLISGLFIAIKTAAPDVTTGDSGELLSASYFLGINHPPGYPLYLICAKLFSYLAYILYPLFFIAGVNPLKIKDPFAFNVNLLSGVFSVLTAIIFYYIALHLIKILYKNNDDHADLKNITYKTIINKFKHEIVFIFSLCLGAINIVWAQSTNSEIYTLNLFLVTILFYSLLKFSTTKNNKYLYLFSFIYGLSIVSHQTNLIFAPVFTLWIIWIKRKIILDIKSIFKMLILMILGLSIYLYLPIRSSVNPPLNWGNTKKLDNFISHILRRQYGKLVQKPQSTTILQAKRSLDMVIKQHIALIKILYRNLTLPLCIIILLGMYEFFKRKRSYLFFLIASCLTYSSVMIYVSNFKIAKLSMYVNEVFFIPVIFLLMLFSIGGIGFLLKNISLNFIKIILVLPVIVIGLNYHLNDDSKNYIISEYTKNILNTTEKNSRLFVMGDNTTFPLAYYHYVKNIRPDLLIIGEYGFVFRDVFKAYNVKEDMPEKFRKKLRDKIESSILNKKEHQVYYTYPATPVFPEGMSLKNYGLIYKLVSNEDELKMDKYVFNSHHFDSIDKKSLYHDLMDRDMASIIYLNLGNYLNNIGETVLASKYSLKSKFVSGTEYAKKRIHFNLALDYKKAGNYKKAMEELFLAIKEDSEYPRAHSLLGNIYSDLGKTKLAVNEFLLAVKYDPGNSKTWNNLGVEYNKINNKKGAFECFKKSIENDPGNYEAYNNLAVILEDFKNYNKAISFYKKAITLNKDYKDAYYNLGTLLLNSNHLKEAYQYLKKAISIYPEYSDAYYNIGILYQKKKDYKSSIDFFKKAIVYRKKFESAYFNLAVSYLWLKKYKNAEIFFKQAININPNSSIAYKHLGNTYYYLNDMKKTYKAWKKGYQLNPKDKELENNVRTLESKGFK